MNNKEIGKKLKDLREEMKLSVAQVAYAVDESIEEVELWENGELSCYGDAKRKLEFLYNHIRQHLEGLEKINEANYCDFFNYPECVSVPDDFPLWLKAHGFFCAPASIGHHSKQPGGLYAHSLAVANELKKYTRKLGLQWFDKDSAWRVGMFHDLCKTDDYILSWSEGSWSWNKNQTLHGHGDKSVIMLQQHIELTEEEVACIRYHMGAFTDKSEWEYYGNAIERFPNVLYTHTADMHASRILGV